VVDEIEDRHDPGCGPAGVQRSGGLAVRAQRQAEGPAVLLDHVAGRGHELVGLHQVGTVRLPAERLVRERDVSEPSGGVGHSGTSRDDDEH
jgi:hypothetical protein